MKGVILLVCAAVSYVAGSAVAWPGAVPLGASVVKTIIPPQVKGFAYSTSQYINAVPSYIPYQPQVSYQVPQYGVYPAFPGYQPILPPTYYPGSSILIPSPSPNPVSPPAGFPSAPSPPSIPQQPSQGSPIPPSQQPGDEDTAVIDSAEFAPGQQQSIEASQSYDAKNMPGYPQIPAVPQIPQAPQIPQVPQIPQIPSIPQIPQYPGSSGITQFPPFPQPPQFQPSPPFQFQPNPAIQQIPPFQQSPQQTQPSGQQTSFPSAPTGDQGLNDEDTISVESA